MGLSVCPSPSTHEVAQYVMRIFQNLGLFSISTSSLTNLLHMYGYPLVGIFVGIESSGIPFPGETMLVTAAVYAGTGHLSIFWVIVAGAAGAIVGDNLGFAAGRKGGRPLVLRYGRYVRVKPEHLEYAERFFAKHGDKTVFLGRFVAVLRAWAALLAGINRMPWSKFLVYNAAGGIVWATVYGMLGYSLGHNLPLLDKVLRILGTAGVVGAVLVVAIAYIVWRRRKAAGQSSDRAPEADDESDGPLEGTSNRPVR
jgi:membrane protein DedA with SNARE-associated domain